MVESWHLSWLESAVSFLTLKRSSSLKTSSRVFFLTCLCKSYRMGSLALGRIVVKEHSFLMNSLALATFLVKEILFRVNDSVANASYHTRTPVRQLLLQDLKSFGIESSSCIKTPKKPSVHSKSLRLKWFQQSVSYRNEQRSFRFRFENLVRNTTSCF